MKNLVITNDFESDKQRVDTKNLRFSWIRKNIHKKKDKLTNQKKNIYNGIKRCGKIRVFRQMII